MKYRRRIRLNTGIVVCVLVAATIDWADSTLLARNFRFIQFEQMSPAKNPGAHAAVTLLFGCPNGTNKCWDVASSSMVDHPTNQRAEARP